MIRSFITAICIGFFIGTALVVYFIGPAKVRAEICHGYVENAKPLKLAREEKISYLQKFQNILPQLNSSSEFRVASTKGSPLISKKKHLVKKKNLTKRKALLLKSKKKQARSKQQENVLNFDS